MAYMSQEKKKQMTPAIKAALKKFGLKGTLSVNNYSTLVLTISDGKIDFIGNFNETDKKKNHGNDPRVFNGYMNVNHYWYKEQFTGDALNALNEIINAMMKGNHNNSDSMTDYFDIGWYIDVNVGKWDKAYKVV